jgi:hypothetical protein
MRDAFLVVIEAFHQWDDGEPKPAIDLEVNYVPIALPISRARTLPWCSDIVPGRYGLRD